MKNADLFEAVYEEIKTPFEQGIVIRQTGVTGDFDSEMVDNPHVYREDDSWYMTYVGHDGEGYRTGLAQSDDLLNWRSLGLILDHGTEPSDWDRYNAGGYLTRDHTWGSAPTLHWRDGELSMLYLGSGEPGYEIGTISLGLATAPNIMGPWTRRPEPVLTPKDDNLERGATWKIFVLPKDGSYIGFVPVGDGRIIGHEWMSIVYSDNLIDWTREPSNPALAATIDRAGNIWGGRQTGDCEVFWLEKHGVWVMVYFTGSPFGIIDSFALSYDLVSWTPSHIPLRHKNRPYNSTFAHKPCIFKHEGIVYHFYNAVGDEGRVIALATSKELG